MRAGSAALNSATRHSMCCCSVDDPGFVVIKRGTIIGFGGVRRNHSMEVLTSAHRRLKNYR